MDPETQATIVMYAILALGGIIGANIIGALLRGGGGVVGRTFIGGLAGAGAGYAAIRFPEIADYAARLNFGMEAPYGAHLQNLLTGLCGGAVIGLIAAILIRPRG